MIYHSKNGLSQFISGYLRVSRDISGYLLLSWPVSAYLSLFWGIPGLYPVKYAILGYLWLSLAISGYLGLSLAILGGLCQVSSIRVPEDAGERKLLQFKLFCSFFGQSGSLCPYKSLFPPVRPSVRCPPVIFSF